MNTDTKTAELIKHIDVSAAGCGCQLRMGDLNGDGRLDFVMVQPDFGGDDRYFPHSVCAATAYSIDGELLWQIGKPCYEDIEYSADIPAQIYDADRDGSNEFLCVMNGEFCIYDGMTGELKRSFPLPDESAHDCIAFADLEGVGYAKNIILKNRFHQIWALDKNFNTLWTYKGNVGRYPIVCDLNGDGKDEIIAGSVVLSADGEVLWELEGSDFPDSVCVGDLNMSGSLMIAAGGEKTNIYSGSGEIKWLLRPGVRTDNIVMGNIRADSFGEELAGYFSEMGEDGYNNGLFMTDYHGNTLFKEKRAEAAEYEYIDTIYNFDGFGAEHIIASDCENGINIFDGYMNPIYHIPSFGTIYCADILSDGISRVLVYDGQSVDIYSAEPCDISMTVSGCQRQQTKKLYNYSIYPYRVKDLSENALGYAIGQFAKPDVRAWAEVAAADESSEPMTRADFCIVICEALQILNPGKEVFFDVRTDDYYYPAVSTIKSLGYLDDIVGKFSPTQPVTAEFAIDIIQKSAEFTPLTTKSGDDELTKRDIAKLILQIYQNREQKENQ